MLGLLSRPFNNKPSAEAVDKVLEVMDQDCEPLHSDSESSIEEVEEKVECGDCGTEQPYKEIAVVKEDETAVCNACDEKAPPLKADTELSESESEMSEPEPKPLNKKQVGSKPPKFPPSAPFPPSDSEMSDTAPPSSPKATRSSRRPSGALSTDRQLMFAAMEKVVDQAIAADEAKYASSKTARLLEREYATIRGTLLSQYRFIPDTDTAQKHKFILETAPKVIQYMIRAARERKLQPKKNKKRESPAAEALPPKAQRIMLLPD